MVRRAVRGTGKALIAAGVLVLAFVVYQLYGTGLAHDRDQRRLQAQFDRRLAAAPTTTTPSGLPAPSLVPATAVPTAPVSGDCDRCVARIAIPKIGLNEVVVDDVEVEDLKRGVGHYPYTKMPGEAGNVGFAGHRTTYGQPFNRIDELEPGDPIVVTTLSGATYRYEMTDQQKVTPDRLDVLDDTPDNRLTMTTCHPKRSDALRLIVTARLVSPVAPETPAPAASPPPGPSPPSMAGEDRPGLSGAATSPRPAVAWGILSACVWLAAWAVGRRSGRRWRAYLVAAPVLLVVLFMFFESFALLLPANI